VDGEDGPAIPEDGTASPESAAWNEACDILTADGMSLDKAAEQAVYMGMYGGDPVARARKLVRLRQAARTLKGAPG
jgi:hypothetical protein